MRTSYVSSSSSDVVVVAFPVTSPSRFSPPVSKRCFSSSSSSSLSKDHHARTTKKKKSRSRGGGYGYGYDVLFVKEVQTARA